MINMVLVQNLLMNCHSVMFLTKDTLWHFLLLGGLGKQF